MQLLWFCDRGLVSCMLLSSTARPYGPTFTVVRIVITTCVVRMIILSWLCWFSACLPHEAFGVLVFVVLLASEFELPNGSGLVLSMIPFPPPHAARPASIRAKLTFEVAPKTASTRVVGVGDDSAGAAINSSASSS